MAPSTPTIIGCIRGKNLFYNEFRNLLFFEGLAKPENERSDAHKKLLGKIVNEVFRLGCHSLE